MSSLTTGPFQNLSATWAQLMQLTPQQMANASAPDYLKIAAMNAQDNIRQQGQPAAGPAAPPVAQQVVDKSVGAPPAGQAMPASPAPAPTQMAAQGGYIHDYGVASLPYEANYGHGGIVSFEGGGATAAPKSSAADNLYKFKSTDPRSEAATAATPEGEDPDGLMQQLKDAINENPNTAKVIAGVGALGAVKLPGGVGFAWGLLPQGAKTALKRYALKALKIGAVAGTGVVAESYLANRLNAPALDAAKTALAGDEALPSDPAATDESEDPGLGIAGLGGGTATLQRTVLPNLVPLDVSEAKTAEQLQEDQDRVNKLYGVGKDFYEEEKARNDAKLSALEAQRKGVYSGQGLMDFGAAMASGESSNFLDNFAKAVPSYTGAIKSGNEYARNRQDLLDTHADLLRGQERSEGRSDAANMLAAESASADKAQAGNNANKAAQNAYGVEQAKLDDSYNTNMANLADKALDRGARAAIAQMSVDLRSKAAAYGGRGLSAKDMALELGKYAAQVLPGLQEQAKELGLEGADAADMIHKLTMSGFAKYMKDSGVAAAPMNNAGRGGIFSDPGDA
jgi:hypothetical protein